jgi:hypothetical protein
VQQDFDGHRSAPRLHLWGVKRESESGRCSSLVDWPVYPRLAHTMQALNDEQCGADALSHRGLARGVGGAHAGFSDSGTASCDFIRHAEEAVSPPASFW